MTFRITTISFYGKLDLDIDIVNLYFLKDHLIQNNYFTKVSCSYSVKLVKTKTEETIIENKKLCFCNFISLTTINKKHLKIFSNGSFQLSGCKSQEEAIELVNTCVNIFLLTAKKVGNVQCETKRYSNSLYIHPTYKLLFNKKAECVGSVFNNITYLASNKNGAMKRYPVELYQGSIFRERYIYSAKLLKRNYAYFDEDGRYYGDEQLVFNTTSKFLLKNITIYNDFIFYKQYSKNTIVGKVTRPPIRLTDTFDYPEKMIMTINPECIKLRKPDQKEYIIDIKVSLVNGVYIHTASTPIVIKEDAPFHRFDKYSLKMNISHYYCFFEDFTDTIIENNKKSSAKRVSFNVFNTNKILLLGFQTEQQIKKVFEFIQV
jgi:hypothetical protein